VDTNCFRKEIVEQRNTVVLSAKNEFEKSVQERKEAFERECAIFEAIKEYKIDNAWRDFYRAIKSLPVK